MKKTPFLKAIDAVVELKLKAADEYIEGIVEQIADVGSPEKLIGKKYEEWTTQDRQMLSQIYGVEEPNPLSELIFRKSYKEVKDLEESE